MSERLIPATLEELMRSSAERWSELQELLAGLSEDDLTRPGVNGDWSVKDLIAHLTAWEEVLIDYLSRRLGGERYQWGDESVDEFNARTFAARRDLPLDDVLRQAEAVHGRLVALLKEVTDEEYRRDEKLRQGIYSNTLEHYVDHLADLRAWRELPPAARRSERGAPS